MASEGVTSADAADVRLRRIVRWSWITLALLLLQNLLGMGLNLYVDLSSYPTIEDAFRAAPALGVHVLTAFAIIGTSAYVFARTVGTKDRRMLLMALAGLGFVLLAFFSGIEFTFFGQVDAFSFLMEAGFVGTIGSVAVVLVMARGPQAAMGPAGARARGPAEPPSAGSEPR